MTTINLTTTLEVETCCACSMTFAMPTDFEQRRRDDHKIFFCPAGHQQHYSSKSKAEKLQEQLNQKEAELRAAEHARDIEITRAAKVAKELKAAKGEATRIATRTKAGVCTCCNRTFKQLAAHMKNKHPEMTK